MRDFYEKTSYVQVRILYETMFLKVNNYRFLTIASCLRSNHGKVKQNYLCDVSNIIYNFRFSQSFLEVLETTEGMLKCIDS